MQPKVYIDALGEQGTQLLRAARTNLGAGVPTCPGWEVRNVLGHLGRVYRSVSGILDGRIVEPPTAPVPKPPEGDAVVDFFAQGLEGLVAALVGIDADTPVYTWGTSKVAGFYHRRMTHETAAHNLDVGLAAGFDTAYDGDLAADGIDELYDEVMPFGLVNQPKPLPGGSLHLHRSDGDGEWTLEPDRAGYVVGRGHVKATAAVRGSGLDLFRFAWNRGRGDSLEVFGDSDVADAWARLAP